MSAKELSGSHFLLTCEESENGNHKTTAATLMASPSLIMNHLIFISSTPTRLRVCGAQARMPGEMESIHAGFTFAVPTSNALVHERSILSR